MEIRASSWHNPNQELGRFRLGWKLQRLWIVTREEEVLAALDKPRALYSVQQLVDPSNKSTDGLQELLMRMRSEGKVKFDIKTGRWRKA